MADAITIKALQDASLDAKSLEEVVNGDEAKQVTTRKGETYPSVKKSIKALFENGGLPATPFATKALMTASDLVDGQYAIVTDDPIDDNNSLHIKKDGVWMESDYSVKSTIENAFGEVMDFEDGANIYDKNRKVWGYQVSSSGAIISSEGRSISPQIPVIAGQDYFVSSVVRNAGLVFLDKNRNEILSSYSNLKNTKVTAPTTARYLVINIDHPSYISNQVMINKGSVAQTYKEYDGEKLKEGVLPSTLLSSSNLADNVKNLGVVRDYEIESDNKNLFNPADIQIDKFLSTNNGAISKGVGWSVSGFIPIIAGQTYTLSGTRARQGLSFFSDNSDAVVPALLYDNTKTLPITVTAPEGANFAVFALESATAKGYSNIQFEKGDAATNYKPYTDSRRILINPEYIASSGSVLSSKSQLAVSDKYNASIECSNTVNIKHQITPNTLGSINRSTVFNFWSDEINGVQVRNPTDDAAPLRADNATIGANHGYSRTEITGTHGKTAADVGSVWTDGSEQFVLIDVASPTVISVTARSDNSGMREPQLTHVSGATNTAVIDAASKTYKQWYPVIKNRTLKTLVDGVHISLDNAATYAYEDCVAFHESYEIMAKTDMVEWVIANGKKQLDSYDAAPSILCNYSYVFDVDGGCTIYASITAYKSIPFADWMLTQSTVLTTGNVSYYVPKTVEFTQDSTTYDFSKLQPVSAPLESSIYFDAAKNEVGANPVDRLIQLSDGVAYATGYLPLLDTAPDVRTTNASNKFLEVRNNSLKVYPRVIDGLKTTLEAGDSYAAIAYRKYFERDNKRTAKYIVRSNIADYLYLDWHSAKTDIIELPDDLIGRNFTVHEKSSNVTLLSKFATNNIAVKVDSTKNYGYLVLRFDK